MFDLMLSHRPLNGKDKTGPSFLMSANVFLSVININHYICIVRDLIESAELRGREFCGCLFDAFGKFAVKIIAFGGCRL